jgi:hypothetical protein
MQKILVDRDQLRSQSIVQLSNYLFTSAHEFSFEETPFYATAIVGLKAQLSA